MENIIKIWAETLAPWLYDHGVKVLFIILGAYVFQFVIGKFVEKAIRLAIVADEYTYEEGEKKREDTLINIINSSLKIAIFFITIMMILQEIGILIGPILAGAGIVGLAFGFGGQYLIRDVISGLFIILESQYRIGDVIKFDTVGGTVENITLRMTTLRDLDGTVHHVPHGEIKKVSNLSKNFGRINLNVGISYSSDIDHVITVINRVGLELAEDPYWAEAINKPPQFLRVDDLGDSAVVVKITGETKPHRKWEVTGELRKRIKVNFDSEGISIPFPQREIWMHTSDSGK
ncbi:MAG: mechanosensitive ion channel family protein [Saprospiraceae bacterium]|jgi:small conductance mechanosensitive channel|nr:mechanosensitive ion channel family protein [Saprospiraceae bacterium]